MVTVSAKSHDLALTFNMDIKSKEERSRNMSKIRATNTKPELFIRSELHKRGFRFRVNFKLVEGHPDIYFSKKRVAVFIHGCYWHRHPNCKFSYTPKSNVDFWMKKFASNVERDKIVMEILRKENIRTVLIWECTIKKMMSDDAIKDKNLTTIQAFIKGEEMQHIEI
jgi:DNA mismatch endonuclease (patch repair protein)